MERVHAERGAPEGAGGPAAFLEPDLVRARVASAAGIVGHRAGPLRRKILEQGAAERDVDQLDAAADAQDRELALARGGEQRELEQVALPTRRIEVGRRLRAVPGGMDVLAAGEQRARPVPSSARAAKDGPRMGDRMTGTPPAASTERT